MQIVWSKSPNTDPESGTASFHGRYQDVLRSVGAWLDARGYRLAKLSESNESLVIEVETGVAGDDLSREVLRLDWEALDRLASAARNDRNRFVQVG